ncbi:bL17 family ribosomal protein [Thalassoglobus sp.]|uniref:bL17 family ribosomal protein n=1 Tax=Thalassoglobus sp. TaxID=2795869 RepID=UPI003AA978AD
MRHRMSGRKLGRNASHRKAMFRNMAASLIKTVRAVEGDEGAAKVPGRIVTTVAKAKELRPYVEKLVTLAKKAQKHEAQAEEYATTAERNTSEWKTWRGSDQWNQWNQAIAPAIDYRRRAFALLRDKDAVDILFSELGERFEDRNGGYTRIVRLAKVRLGDAGEQALIEFVGIRDRVKTTHTAPVVVDDEEPTNEASSVESDSEAAEEADSPEAEASDETPEVEASSEEEKKEE